jgi:DNA-binding transcriptional ArsR family regulator
MNPNPKNILVLKTKVFYALSDPARVRTLEFLRDGEKCVCEIVPHLNIPQPVVSRHLKILKDAGLLCYRKDGTKRLYAVSDQRIYAVVDSVTSQLADVIMKNILDQAMKE